MRKLKKSGIIWEVFHILQFTFVLIIALYQSQKVLNYLGMGICRRNDNAVIKTAELKHHPHIDLNLFEAIYSKIKWDWYHIDILVK